MNEEGNGVDILGVIFSRYEQACINIGQLQARAALTKQASDKREEYLLDQLTKAEARITEMEEL